MEIYLLNASSKVGEQQASDLLKLHYRYLDHQATLLKIKMTVPKLNARQLIEGNCVVLVYLDGVAVGYCSYRNRNGSLKIRSLYVLPDYRQRGVMKEIFKAIAADEAFSEIVVGMYAKCKEAKEYFIRRGYQAVYSRDREWVDFSKSF